ncbi:MAG: hypothetical protein R2791_08380 [Saprospiraceae bacterium]
MKNKHLVYLFFATLLAGLLLRQLPWRPAQWYQTDLIRNDTAALVQIGVQYPGVAELLMERTETGWAATRELQTILVASAQMDPLLSALSRIRSIRIVKSNLLDTLELGTGRGLNVVYRLRSGKPETIEIGREMMESGRPATFIRLNDHGGVYLVEGHLRSLFPRDLDALRSDKVAVFDPAVVDSFIIQWKDDTLGRALLLHKKDTSGHWMDEKSESDETIHSWLELFGRLNGSPFAKYFDEYAGGRTLDARIALFHNAGDSIVLRLFYTKPPDLPEDVSVLKGQRPPEYVLHSSQNPRNYFAPGDSILLKHLFFGPVAQSRRDTAISRYAH